MSEYQYYEFLAVDRPLDERQQAEVRALSTRARVTATSFTNEYHWGNFRGDPRTMMERYYDAHLYLTNWGTHQVMLRLPRALLSLETAEQYCIDPHVAAWTSGEHLILDLISEDESGDWVEGAEDSLSAIVGVRAELAAGDLRPLYLAWLAAYGIWERDEDAFDYDEENDLEPPVPAGLGALTAPQRALADFLRLDTDLLTIAGQGEPAPGRDERRSPQAGQMDQGLARRRQGHTPLPGCPRPWRPYPDGTATPVPRRSRFHQRQPSPPYGGRAARRSRRSTPLATCKTLALRPPSCSTIPPAAVRDRSPCPRAGWREELMPCRRRGYGDVTATYGSTYLQVMLNSAGVIRGPGASSSTSPRWRRISGWQFVPNASASCRKGSLPTWSSRRQQS